jgi:hypothetical protein
VSGLEEVSTPQEKAFKSILFIASFSVLGEAFEQFEVYWVLG